MEKQKKIVASGLSGAEKLMEDVEKRVNEKHEDILFLHILAPEPVNEDSLADVKYFLSQWSVSDEHLIC